MKKIFENYRRFLTEDELLVEARETDALKRVVKGIKNEELQEFLTANMEMLFKIDPSGNQKYALWIAKMLNASAHRSIKEVEKERFAVVDYLDSIKAGIDTSIRAIRQNLALYHKLTQRNLIDKDINIFATEHDWAHATYRANQEFEEKERMKAMAKQAKSETDVLEDGDDYMVVRPRSKEGSCYFGQGTRWCISATKSQNYFDSYTAEGKGFYFVFFHHLPQKDSSKKLAMVFVPGYDEPEEVYDVPDDEVGEDGLRSAIEMNLLMKGLYASLIDKKKVKKILKSNPAYLSDMAESFDADMSNLRNEDVLSPQLKKVFEGLGIDLGPEETNEENMPSHAEEAFDEMISEDLWEIIASAASHWDQNPAGPTEEDYQKIEDEHELQHFYVSREEMDEGRMYWDAGTTFQFDDVDDLVEDAVDRDVLRDFVDSAADAHYIYGEVEDNSWGGNLEMSLRINPDHGEHEGLEGFKSFMETVASADKEWQNVYDAVIDKMKDAGWIPGESMKALLEKFNEMKFQNFDVELEDGNIEASSRLNVRILLPDELKTGGRMLSTYDRDGSGTNLKKVLWMSILKQLKEYENTSAIGNQLVDHIKSAFDKAMGIAAAQMKLPLNEEKEEITVPEFNIQFGALGPKNQGSINRTDNRDQKYDVSDTFTYWLDVVVEGEETEEEIKTIQKFLRLIDNERLFEKVRQYTEGLVNKQLQKIIIPKAREEVKAMVAQQAETSVDTMRATNETKNIFENWRKFIK